MRSILTLRDELEGAAHQTEDSAETRGKREELKSILDELDRVQAGSPLVPFCVNAQTVAEVISAWTGIPLGKMLRDEIATVSRLHELLGERIIGQQHALEEIAKRIRIARANLDDPGKPKGVFLLVGTSGVGKTETALALADILYGGERNIVTINMSEYQEAHSVSTLKGSPPGYVGYGKGGVLTEAVRRRPHSVVLLDEVEKAHPDVRELFFQVFDKGTMEDAEGREIDFKNTIIVLTSNVGTEEIMGACQQLDPPPTVEQLVGLVRPLLNKAFKPAFIGRLTVIPFYPIVGDVLKRIVRLKLEKIQRRVLQNHGASLNLDEGVVDAIAARCTESDSGARLIDNILSGTLLPKVSDDVLGKMARGERFNRIDVRMADNGTFSCEVT